MFCQLDFISNKIFAFLNASIDWSKKNRCYRNNFKGYFRYKTIFCHKVALDAQLMNFFI